MKSNKYCIYFINTIKSPKMFTKSCYNNGRKYGCNKRSQNFYFYFDWPKDVDGNLKHGIEFITKRNES